jgi:hypothetical protein
MRHNDLVVKLVTIQRPATEPLSALLREVADWLDAPDLRAPGGVVADVHRIDIESHVYHPDCTSIAEHEVMNEAVIHIELGREYNNLRVGDVRYVAPMSAEDERRVKADLDEMDSLFAPPLLYSTPKCGTGFEAEFEGVCVLGYMDRSLADFGRSLRARIEEETKQANPDTALIRLLCDAARLGWELLRAVHSR